MYPTSLCSCVFSEWPVESGNKEINEFEKLSPEKLGELLEEFYFGVRSKSGKEYSRSAFKSIQAALQWHLESKPYDRKINLSQDPEFLEANQVFDGYMSRLRKEGKDKTQHKEPITREEAQKLYSHVFVDTPQGLQFRDFYEIVMHFGRRGREGCVR